MTHFKLLLIYGVRWGFIFIHLHENVWLSQHNFWKRLFFPYWNIYFIGRKMSLEKRYGIQQRRQWHPTPVLLPGKSYGRRSLVGCSPCGRWGSDTTERLHFHFSLSYIGEGNGNPLQCSCLENPRDREPGGLPSMGSHSVGHDWSDLAAAVTSLPEKEMTTHSSILTWRIPWTEEPDRL